LCWSPEDGEKTEITKEVFSVLSEINNENKRIFQLRNRRGIKMNMPTGIWSITLPVLALGLTLIIIWAIQRNHRGSQK